MSYQRLNILTGWLVFLAALVTYMLTLEPTMSFWDCGEFIATAYKLEVGHPPGAPLFMLLARLFVIPVSDPALVPYWVNMVSAMSSAFTILFLFWSITHLAKKLAAGDGAWSVGRMVAVIGSGVVGALVYTWSDTFWFSAVEGEVYAMSSLFTALVFWAILKWEANVEQAAANGVSTNENRWLIFIAYMMGLSIGVHLLNLLAIPAICFVYYFKKFPVTRKGVIYTSVIALLLLALIQVGIISGAVKLAGLFELFFVNELGMAFNSGTLVYISLLLSLIIFGLYWSRRKAMPVLNTFILGVTFAFIGYSTFTMIPIRSAADPPINENKPNNLFAILAYLNREQYGDRPLLHGPFWNTPTTDDPFTDGPPSYIKSYSVYTTKGTKPRRVLSCRDRFEAEAYVTENADKNYKIVSEYIDSGEKKSSKPVYDPKYCTLFPRMYSSVGNHIREYKSWSDYQGFNNPAKRAVLARKEKMYTTAQQKSRQFGYYLNQDLEPRLKQMVQDSLRYYTLQERALNKQLIPTFVEDKRFFFRYQVGWMYLRYFMWNFAGRQNDIQGHGDFREGNWISGITSIDQQRLGNQKALPDAQLTNRAFNKFYYLPLILGLIGLIFQLVKNVRDFTVVTLLFLMTGAAIVVYLNQTPLQPRERDYAYAGSFYAFTIWIGLAVYALYHVATRLAQKQYGVLAAMTLGGTAVIFLLESVVGNGHAFSYTLAFMSVVTLSLCGIMFAAGKILPDLGKGALATLLCLAVPFVMVSEGWDDHSRAKRRTGIDFAKNYLDSLEPNALIFTNGDNDTFPLWYAQEVEGYRTDVRIVNLSLLNTDWYIDQMKRQAYDSAPVPLSMKEQKYRQGTRDIVLLRSDLNPSGAYMDIHQAFETAMDDSKTEEIGDGRFYNYFPTDRFRLDLDSAAVEPFRKYLSPGDSLVSSIVWQIGENETHITKNQLTVLDIIRSNKNWERPVYFAVTTGPEVYMGLEPYFQLEGLAYRLVPILHKQRPNPNIDGGVNTELMYQNMMNEFGWGNMDKEEIYLDENNRRMTTNLRLQFSNLAEALIAENKRDSAKVVIDKSFEVMPEKNVPFDRVILPLIESYFEAGDSLNGRKYAERLFEITGDELDYFESLDKARKAGIESDYTLQIQINLRLMETVLQYFPEDEKLGKMKEEMDTMLEKAADAFPDDEDLIRYKQHFERLKERHIEFFTRETPRVEF
jgi:hypothetical protein